MAKAVKKKVAKKTKSTKSKRNVSKSIWAVLAGFLVVVLLSTMTDSLLESAGLFPQPDTNVYMPGWMLFLALLYRSAYTVLGGYVTAMLAPQNPMKHVKVLAVIGTIGGVIGMIVGWNLSEHWYPIALAVTAYPLVWWGGKLRLKKA
jgi:hypothetical protein